MSRLLPLFPLQLVVYPGEGLNLHIFEPRYRQLIKECEEEGATFGIPAFIDGKVMEVGTEMELLSVEKRYPDGKLDIKTRGKSLFRVEKFFRTLPDKLYSGAEVRALPFDTNGNVLANTRILELAEQLFNLLNIDRTLPAGPNDFVTYDIAHYVGFSLEQEYQLLCVTDELSRQEFMKIHLEKLVPVVEEMEKLRKKARMNGHFKKLKPPKF